MLEYTVRRSEGWSREAEARLAEFYGYDEAVVVAAKEEGVRILAETLGIESGVDDWSFNCGSDYVWVHTFVDELPITVHVEDSRKTHEGRIFSRIDPGGDSVAHFDWIRTVEDLDDAIRRNRHYIEHPYKPGPYDNMG